jgi:hypothetical protein
LHVSSCFSSCSIIGAEKNIPNNYDWGQISLRISTSLLQMACELF